MKNNNKTSFFTNVKDSICSFEKYPEMATKPATTIYKYFIQFNCDNFVLLIFLIALNILRNVLSQS